jgi:hypothetical protein
MVWLFSVKVRAQQRDAFSTNIWKLRISTMMNTYDYAAGLMHPLMKGKTTNVWVSKTWQNNSLMTSSETSVLHEVAQTKRNGSVGSI